MNRVLKHKQPEAYVDAFHLLAMAEKCAALAKGVPVDGSGTAEDPWTMDSAAKWISAWRGGTKQQAKLTYFRLAGRLLSKGQNTYIGDAGPAWRKGVGARDAIHDPTYNFGAQRIRDPSSIFPQRKIDANKAGVELATSWGELKRSTEMARAIRRLLKGERLTLAGKTNDYGHQLFDRNYSRKQALWPVFTVAIFLAEPARNKRAWPINLMLLDLAQAAKAGFTWDAILWHPQAIGPKVNVEGDVQGDVYGPRSDQDRTVVKVTKVGGLHYVGGLLPSSPTMGGVRGKPALYGLPKKLHPEALKRGVRPVHRLIKVKRDYIHEKEMDVLVKWLLAIPDIRQKWELAPNYTGRVLKGREVVNTAVRNQQQITNDLQLIERKLETRTNSLDMML